jgi:flagellin-like protein
MKIRENKRGISPVIATILLILITVAAVSILWAFVIPMIRENTETATVCFDAQQQMQIETANGKTCFKESVNSTGSPVFAGSSDNVSVQLRKVPGSSSAVIKDVQLIFTDASGETFSYRLLSLNCSIPGDNEAKTCLISGLSEEKNPVQIAVAPIVRTGNTEKPCAPSSPADIPACA